MSALYNYICKTLKHKGCTRQAMCPVAKQRDDKLRAEFMTDISIYDPSMFVWMDETGCDKRNTKVWLQCSWYTRV